MFSFRDSIIQDIHSIFDFALSTNYKALIAIRTALYTIDALFNRKYTNYDTVAFTQSEVDSIINEMNDEELYLFLKNVLVIYLKNGHD